MNAQDRALVEKVWTSVRKDPFDPLVLFDECAREGGHDFVVTGLTVGALKDVWLGAETANWHGVGFLAGELLAFHCVSAASLSEDALPRWAFAALLARDAIRHGFSSWDLQIDKILAVLASTEGAVEKISKVEVLRSIVCEHKA